MSGLPTLTVAAKIVRQTASGVWLGLTLAAITSGAATFTVTTTSDSGAGSLRWAITNANATPGPDIITFNLSGSAPFTILPLTLLPPVLEPVIMDGTTQPGYGGNPLIELRGTSAGTQVNGLYLLTSNCVIRALCINRFSKDGIRIELGASNVVQGCYIGTGPRGTNALGNSQGGISILSAGNVVGGTNAADRNVISGGNLTGIYLIDPGARYNQVLGNYIGLDATGSNRLGNAHNGVTVSGASENVIGGTSPGTANVISGNAQSGVYLSLPYAVSNRVEGNFIGTDAAGLRMRSNAVHGIIIFGAVSTVVGGTNPAARNLISGNATNGIHIASSPAGGVSNVIAGNWIGLDVTGTNALPNGARGIELFRASYNTLGHGNVIAANRASGVAITGGTSTNNRVAGNFIGVDISGARALGNGFDGVLLSGVSNNIVGGTTPAERNLISGNGENGVYGYGNNARGNVISGNYIGTDLTGMTALANTASGVMIEGPGNTVGGATAGAGNLLSGNAGNGVYLLGLSASNNVIAGNIIGLDAAGNLWLGNAVAGIGLTNAPDNLIGGLTPAARNVISANGDSGIYLLAAGAAFNVIQGNYIGTTASGTQIRANLVDGITGYNAPSNTVGGNSTAARNVISGNGWNGIYLTGAGTEAWTLQGNMIGTRPDGTGNLGNANHNVEMINNASSHLVGGTALGAGNVIAYARGAGWDGVRIRDGSTNNLVVGNSIFSNGGSSAAGLGIDLGSDGVTLNDPCDADSGGNHLQNFPVLSHAWSSDLATGIRGTLNSKAGGVFALDFYANSAPEPSGYGEGQLYLGRVNVQTAASCSTNFTASLATGAPAGGFITATATDAAGNTSELSQAIPFAPPPTLKFEISNLQSQICWPTNAPGFVLQQTPALTPPVVWTPVTNAVVVSGSQYVVTLATTHGNCFYRLVLP
jgi:hypothetical protein